jgi:cytochrome c oxidase cbb3-type subunit 3
MLKKIIFTLLSAVLTSSAIAQTEVPGNQSSNIETLLYIVIGLVLVISILVLLVAIYTLFVVRTILSQEQAKAESEGAEIVPEVSIWKKISKSLTRATPIEKEADILLDHNYDGIRELDNHLPPWWKWLFYLSIVWSIVYLALYHVFDLLPLSGEEYNNEIVRAEAALEARRATMTELIDETNVEVATDDAALENGSSIFVRQCAVCHQPDGGGNVGPNMTDQYWIHGGDIKDLFRTIKYGVPEKGMISWQSQLSPGDMRDVSSYILTLQGTTPANPKEPQGELYVPEETPEEETAAEETTTEETDVEETAAEETDVEETDADEIDAEETDAEEKDAEETDAEKTGA